MFGEENIQESSVWFRDVPAVIDVELLPPVHTERFAMKLTFDNGECKKYILPIREEYEKDEVVSFECHVFTDKIWRTAKITKSIRPYRGTVISFSNDYFVSAMKCYAEGVPFPEAARCWLPSCWSSLVKTQVALYNETIRPKEATRNLQTLL